MLIKKKVVFISHVVTNKERGEKRMIALLCKKRKEK